MNPWSDGGPKEETAERGLFERRARALGPAAVPSLASVLRAVDAPKEPFALRGSRGRTLMAMTLAAACMMAAVTRLPSSSTHATIRAESDAGAARVATTSVSYETAAADTCTMDDDRLVSEETVCLDLSNTFYSTAPKTTPAVSVPPCVPNESCAISMQ